jgi:hypothetical protein
MEAKEMIRGIATFMMGISIICLFVMLIVHEYMISEIIFIVGLIAFGICYAKLPKGEKPEINTKKVNENIQTLNDILWGKEGK